MTSLGFKTLSLAASGVALATLLVGCAGDVPMEPAADSNNPACADVIVRLPQTVSGLDRRTTNAQATGAWGDPAGVELVCGEATSGPTTDTCVTVNDVDWIVDESNAPIYRFEAYGRSPGLAVYVNSEEASGTDTVVDLSAVAKILPQDRKCTSVSDTFDITKQE